MAAPLRSMLRVQPSDAGHDMTSGKVVPSGMATPRSLRYLIAVAVALSMGAALSLGIARFAYGLLLPPMRQDLDWSYTLAGAMNTANALGYLLGALFTPQLLRRWGASRVLLGGAD